MISAYSHLSMGWSWSGRDSLGHPRAASCGARHLVGGAAVISFPRLLGTAPVADHSPSGSPSQSTRAALLLSMMPLGALKSLETSPMGVCTGAIDEGRAMELIRRHLRPAGGGGGDLTDPETGRTIGCRDFQYAYECAPATGEAGLTGITAWAVLLDGCGRPVRKGPLHLLRDWRARTLNVPMLEDGGILRGADSLRPRTAAAAGVHGIPPAA